MSRTLTQNIFAKARAILRPSTQQRATNTQRTAAIIPQNDGTPPSPKPNRTSKEYILHAENNTGILIYTTNIQQQKAISFAVTHRKEKISVICRIIPQHDTNENFTTIINESIDATINILAKIGVADEKHSGHSKMHEIRNIMNYMQQHKDTFCQDAKACHDAA